ncbi:MAG: hypothetical protein E6J34_05515 [Chloroflexi bacterium]|jgi:hypothetical protein|nr:MAG: hypothetical protein E6J34_05515 [Chloroflexota bacterium]
MQINEFRRPISVDFVPHGSLCEWCNKPAEQQLTAIGGSHHNESGRFCRPCGEQFTQVVVSSFNLFNLARADVRYNHRGEYVAR